MRLVKDGFWSIPWFANHEELVNELQKMKSISSPHVIKAFKKVDRRLFVDKKLVSIGGEDFTYVDQPLPIGHEQTISQPSLVGQMIEELDLAHGKGMSVLEVGAGSGWSTALIANVMGNGSLHSFELIPELLKKARKTVRRFVPKKVKLGMFLGDPVDPRKPRDEKYDRIIVHAAMPLQGSLALISLLRQLKIGGKLLAPIRLESGESLVAVTRTGKSEFKSNPLKPVSFVPLKGRHGFRV